MLSYSTYSDPQLVDLLKQSDQKAFTELYERYWKPLFYKAGKKLKDLSEAENIVQEIFLDLWRRRNVIEIAGELSHYLAVALKYRIINFQSAKYNQTLRIDDISEEHLKAGKTTEEYLAASELNRKMAALVDRLPAKCKLAFQLREEGLSQKEFAGQMGISENTVETHIGRALKSLRSGIANFISLFL
jgi:RNA polymerase sigma-70 factor (ECF subfamily)